MKKTYRKMRGMATAIAMVFGLALSAQAVDYFWGVSDNGDPDDGDFGTVGNWRWDDDGDWVYTGIPGDNDTIILDREATETTAYTITLDQTRTLSDGVIDVRKDYAILDMDVKDLTFSHSGDTRNFLMGDVSGATGTLVIEGGGTFTVNNIGMGSSASSTLIVRGAGTVFDGGSSGATLGSRPFIGENHASHIRVAEGGTVKLDNPITAYSSGGGGSTITVTGTDGAATPTPSTLDITGGTLLIGRRQSVTVTIEDGGRLIGGRPVMLGERGSTSLIIDNGSAVVGTVTVGNWTGEHRLDALNGGQVTASTLNLAFPSREDRYPRAYAVADGMNAENVASKITVTGNATVGLRYDTAKEYLGNSTSYWLYESYLTATNGGEVQVDGRLTVNYSATVTIKDGTIQTTDFVVGEDDGGDENIPVYDLTLTENSGLSAPLRVVTGTHDGDVELGNLVLKITLDESLGPLADDGSVQFGVLRYAGDLTGQFFGLSQGATFWDEDEEVLFQIDYFGHDGTDDAIVLTVIPEPHTIGLLLTAGILLALRRRRIVPGE